MYQHVQPSRERKKIHNQIRFQKKYLTENIAIQAPISAPPITSVA